MAVGDKSFVVMETEKGVENGVATLGSDGVLSEPQRPSLSQLGGLQAPLQAGILGQILSLGAENTPEWVDPPASGVSSFNRRSGAVMPQSGDYTASMVGAAPSGFGLGSAAGAAVSSWDDATENGYYTAPAPSGIGSGNLWGFTCSLSSTYKFQEIYVDSSQNVVTRFMIAGEWQPFEWVNPPMQLGVEYRTTECYNGKPVYFKLVNFGKLPNSTNSSVSHNIENISTVVFGELMDQDGELITDYYMIDSFVISRANIVIKTTGDMSTSIGTVFMKYTKTTD